MKNKIKFLISSILVCLLCVSLVGCSSTNSLMDYAIKQGLDPSIQTTLPTNGTNGVDGADGKDGDSIDLYEVYTKLVELGEFSGSYSEFVQEYLQTEPVQTTANKAMTSVVSVFSAFTSSISYSNGITTGSFTQKYYGAGAGVIFRLDKTTGDALIITNYHVIYDNDSSPNISNEISIMLYGNESYSLQTTDQCTIGWDTYYYKELISDSKISATYLGGSMLYDIAVLKVTNSELLKTSYATQADIADSNEIAVGERVVAVGNPSGAGISATEGIISVDSEYISMTGVDNQTTCTYRVIRTDTAINGGNSGGGLFNADGELVGIVNAKITSSSIDNIGYAIPSNIAQAIAKNIIRNCDGETATTVKRSTIGINVTATSSSAVQNYTANGLKTSIVETVAVGSVTSGSASDGVLEVGDILKTATILKSTGTSNSITITRTFHLVDFCLNLEVGDQLTLERTANDGTAKTPAVFTITADMVSEWA